MSRWDYITLYRPLVTKIELKESLGDERRPLRGEGDEEER